MTDEALQQLLVLDDARGPALAIDAAYADTMIDAALAGAGFGPAGGGGAAGGLGSKLAVVVGTAVVALVIAVVAWRSRGGESEQVVAVISDAAIVEPGPAAIAPAEVPVEIAEPAPIVTRPDRRPESTEPVADLLGAANAKRAAKQWRESEALYARVVERAPRSMAAQTALVASASLHLEHLGDPKGAAQRFRRALAIAPRGVLAEEARWGIAEAARALRDTRGETAALDDFLAHHAGSPLVTQAKARRAELP
ncbi:hypothetical protein BH11MYX3_BH11MYX3_44940 [soil metagenome]